MTNPVFEETKMGLILVNDPSVITIFALFSLAFYFILP